MKKLILLASLSFLVSGSALMAQSFSLSNYTLTVSDGGNTTTLESFVQLDNSGSNPIEIMLERTINSLPTGMDELFCFGIYCNPPGTPITTYTTLLDGNSSDNTFKADVVPNGNCGLASIHYRFFDANNNSDSVGITLNFDFCSVGVLKI